MTTNDELDIIARTRLEVMGERVPTGENLFLAWGYPTAIILVLEFAALMWLKEDWCGWGLEREGDGFGGEVKGVGRKGPVGHGGVCILF